MRIQKYLIAINWDSLTLTDNLGMMKSSKLKFVSKSIAIRTIVCTLNPLVYTGRVIIQTPTIKKV